VYSDKQIHVDVDTIVSFVMQSGQVSDDVVISLLRHVNDRYLIKYLILSLHTHFLVFFQIYLKGTIKEWRAFVKNYDICWKNTQLVGLIKVNYICVALSM